MPSSINKGSESSKCIYGNSQTYVLTIKTDTPKPLKSKGGGPGGMHLNN
jgi:hypothetical protein